ncbi:hypothetical protein BU23DRAFT_41691 [Bimuria novae-zelandiae CBS 107.79]|uniref:Uncharacterized protein n=1 Tax=Bimuria novae-zelandiae CBS 107.79 TaxID=1447943 RepID=A0A6A5VSB8_9PLEO|nr:hypothetical protein BU23DRAFT_41691 [Bimuria novae-zelandiae CBS 107.79]
MRRTLPNAVQGILIGGSIAGFAFDPEKNATERDSAPHLGNHIRRRLPMSSEDGLARESTTNRLDGKAIKFGACPSYDAHGIRKPRVPCS